MFARGFANDVRELSGSIGLSGLIPAPRTRPLSFLEALETVGVPTTSKTPEEELLDLLQSAAEVELGLMSQYLYANYSLKVPAISGVIRMIAIEEMGHFVSVQNLLIACGAEPYFGNGRWSLPTDFQPFPFKLEPASLGSLAKYTVAEMPDDDQVPTELKPVMRDIIAAADALVKSPIEAHRVGLLYTQIYWLLRPNDDPMEDEPWEGFPVARMASKLKGRHVGDSFIKDATNRNALPEHWKGNFSNVIVLPISGRQAALQMIAKVSGQGEGFGKTPDGHFERFARAWISAKNSPDIAVTAPVNPFYDNAARPGGGDRITSSAGIQFARLADGLLELVLLCIAENLLLPVGTAPAVRGRPASAAVLAMREGLKVAANALTQIPLTDDQGERKVCGLPFSAVPDLEADPKAILKRLDTVLGGLRTVLSEIAQGNGSDEIKGLALDIGTALDDVESILSSLQR